METRRIEMLLEAVQPVAHAEQTFGNTSVAMRRKIRLPDGDFVRVPIITADTMRHGMREASSYALLDAAGLLDGRALSEPALRLLFSGGMITGASGGSVKLGDFRELVDLVPPLALFGGCAQNRAIPGRLQVSDALLVCEETRHLVPDWIAEEAGELASHRDHVEEVQRVRMDPSLDPSKRLLMRPQDQEDAEQRLLLSENASATGDKKAADQHKSSMMPRRHESVVSGSLFSWRVTATTYTELDDDTLMVALGAFLSHAVVGGKRGTGHGRIRCIAARGIELSRPSERTVIDSAAALSTGKVGELFRAHVRERSEQIAAFLDKVTA